MPRPHVALPKDTVRDLAQTSLPPIEKAEKHDAAAKRWIETVYHDQEVLGTLRIWSIPFPGKPPETPSHCDMSWFSWARTQIAAELRTDERLLDLIPFVTGRFLDLVQFHVPIDQDNLTWWQDLKRDVPIWRGYTIEGLLLIHGKDKDDSQRLSDLLNSPPQAEKQEDGSTRVLSTRRLFSDAIYKAITWRLWPRCKAEMTQVDQMLEGVNLGGLS